MKAPERSGIDPAGPADPADGTTLGQVQELTGETAGGLAGALAQLARTLDAADGAHETLQALVQAAVAVIPGAESVGITHARRGERVVDVRYASDQLVLDLDGAQDAAGEGPGLEAVTHQHTVLVEDFALEQRWPRFSARARELGAGSMMSLRLFAKSQNMGALNVYSRRAYAFDQRAQEIGLLFATHAAIGWAGARREQELRRALQGRDVIGQAKGVLMERFAINADEAFGLLAKTSADTNVKLRTVAERFVDTPEQATTEHTEHTEHTEQPGEGAQDAPAG